jgi:hypothetical protein
LRQRSEAHRALAEANRWLEQNKSPTSVGASSFDWMEQLDWDLLNKEATQKVNKLVP